MNEEYLDKYKQLIARRKSLPFPDTEYGENHHIKPRCICPEEDKNPDNIVRLSAYEHFDVRCSKRSSELYEREASFDGVKKEDIRSSQREIGK